MMGSPCPSDKPKVINCNKKTGDKEHGWGGAKCAP